MWFSYGFIGNGRWGWYLKSNFPVKKLCSKPPQWFHRSLLHQGHSSLWFISFIAFLCPIRDVGGGGVKVDSIA